MICPQCKEEGQKSKVFIGSSVTTTAGWQGYYDEEGEYHFHDPNVTTHSLRCSNGHEFTERTTSKCSIPGCNWNKDNVQGSA